ncbi:MAG: SpoIIE family protein phosphatase [Actinomycetota bacterium]|nr:SpoIIE family protein phosphatase [Actinomycetota bacterium]
MDANSETNRPSESYQELEKLRLETSRVLGEKNDELLRNIEDFIEKSYPAYSSLPTNVLYRIRQNIGNFLALYREYFEGVRSLGKSLGSVSAEVSSDWSGVGVEVGDVLAIYDKIEPYLWRAVSSELLPKDYSPRAWLQLMELRGEFNRRFRERLHKAYTTREQQTADRQLLELEAISDLGRIIVSNVELESVLRQILEVATSLMQVRMGAILLLESTGKNLEAVAGKGLSRTWLHRERLPLERSLSGVALQRGEHVFAQGDELLKFELPRVTTGKKIRSALSIPIPAGGELLGTIELYDTAPKMYGERDIALITAFAPQAGIAIKNAQLFQREQELRRQAITLADIAQSVSETQDLRELLNIIIGKTAQALNAPHCSIFGYDSAERTLTFLAGHGQSSMDRWFLDRRLILVDDVDVSIGRALEKKEFVITSRRSWRGDLEARILYGEETNLVLNAPLVFEGEVLGLLSVGRVREEPFTDEDIRLALSIARQAAVAVYNRRLEKRLIDQQVAIRNAEINEKLYRERERSEAVLKATPDAVVVIDKDRRIVLTNPAAEFLIGWEGKETIGRRCHEVLRGLADNIDECPDETCAIRRTLSGEKVVISEEELVSRSGQRIPVSGTFAALYDANGEVENVVAIYRDISEQKELEKYALMQKELQVASDIQGSLLPKEEMFMEKVSICARQCQARRVGGDWFDYWWDDNNAYIVIGDASGSGVPAALFATMAMSAIRVAAREYESVIEVMEHVNRSLRLSNSEENFVTLFFGVLNLSTLELAYSNAGHEEAFYLPRGKSEIEKLSSGKRLPLGIFDSIELDVNSRKLSSGDRLVLFTDGMVDARNTKGKFYGLKRLERAIASHRNAAAADLVDFLIGDVLNFSGGEVKDDVTVMVVDIN